MEMIQELLDKSNINYKASIANPMTMSHSPSPIKLQKGGKHIKEMKFQDIEVLPTSTEGVYEGKKFNKKRYKASLMSKQPQLKRKST